MDESVPNNAKVCAPVGAVSMSKQTTSADGKSRQQKTPILAAWTCAASKKPKPTHHNRRWRLVRCMSMLLSSWITKGRCEQCFNGGVARVCERGKAASTNML